MSRIARRGIEPTNNKFLRLDVVCRLIMNCWYGITTSTNAAEQGGDHQDDDDSKTPLQYTLVSNRNGVSEDKGRGEIISIILCPSPTHVIHSHLHCSQQNNCIHISSEAAVSHFQHFVKGFAFSFPGEHGALKQHSYALLM